MRFRSKNDEPEAEINLTPLIDVVFLLLIFFMVTTTFSREAEIKLKLPEATSSDQASDDEKYLTIQITDIGQFAVQGPGEDEPRELINTSETTLQRAVKAAAGDMQDPIVVIRADRLATHESVVQAMNAARNLGFFQVTFSTGMPN